MALVAWKRAKPSIITLADQARDAGKWEIAARYYRTALSRNPQRSPIWIQYGHVLKEAGSLAEAEKAYRAAVAHNRSDADGRHFPTKETLLVASTLGRANIFRVSNRAELTRH